MKPRSAPRYLEIFYARVAKVGQIQMSAELIVHICILAWRDCQDERRHMLADDWLQSVLLLTHKEVLVLSLLIWRSSYLNHPTQIYRVWPMAPMSRKVAYLKVRFGPMQYACWQLSLRTRLIRSPEFYRLYLQAMLIGWSLTDRARLTAYSDVLCWFTDYECIVTSAVNASKTESS